MSRFFFGPLTPGPLSPPAPSFPPKGDEETTSEPGNRFCLNEYDTSLCR